MTREEIVTCLSERLNEMRRRFSVQGLALFGSAARDRIAKGSDIDVLVVFEGKPTFGVASRFECIHVNSIKA